MGTEHESARRADYLGCATARSGCERSGEGELERFLVGQIEATAGRLIPQPPAYPPSVRCRAPSRSLRRGLWRGCPSGPPRSWAALVLLVSDVSGHVGRIEDGQRHVWENRVHLVQRLRSRLTPKDSTSHSHPAPGAGVATSVASYGDVRVQRQDRRCYTHIGWCPEHILSKPGPLTTRNSRRSAHPKKSLCTFVSSVPLPSTRRRF